MDTKWGLLNRNHKDIQITIAETIADFVGYQMEGTESESSSHHQEDSEIEIAGYQMEGTESESSSHQEDSEIEISETIAGYVEFQGHVKGILEDEKFSAETNKSYLRKSLNEVSRLHTLLFAQHVGLIHEVSKKEKFWNGFTEELKNRLKEEKELVDLLTEKDKVQDKLLDIFREIERSYEDMSDKLETHLNFDDIEVEVMSKKIESGY